MPATLPFGVKDLTNDKFDRLRVVRFSHLYKKPCGSVVSYWLCLCDCGRKVKVSREDLKRGSTRSCGCLRSDLAKQRKKHGCWSAGNNDPKMRAMYFTWKGIKARCNNPKATGYHNYGGRGIRYCNRWEAFKNFYDDMQGTWVAGLELDRINTNRNYYKSNCRWATSVIQNNNTRYNVHIRHEGRTITLAQFCRLTGIKRHAARSLIAKGMLPAA